MYTNRLEAEIAELEHTLRDKKAKLSELGALEDALTDQVYAYQKNEEEG